jgi:hypothetical protein
MSLFFTTNSSSSSLASNTDWLFALLHEFYVQSGRLVDLLTKNEQDSFMHNAPNQSLFHSRYLVGRTLLWQIKVLTCSQLYFSMAFWWNPVRLLQHQDYPFLLAIV